MKVKVGNTVYDGEDQPVMAILTEQDKLNIARMSVGSKRYCVFPAELDRTVVDAWMREGTDDGR